MPPIDEQPIVPSDCHDEGPVFHTAMAHLYRAEMSRMTVWRQRLDTTSNWAIILTFGMSTFVLGTPNVPHYVMLLGLAIVSAARFINHLDLFNVTVI